MGFIIFSRHIDGYIPFLSICENIYAYALAKTGTDNCSISLDIPSVTHDFQFFNPLTLFKTSSGELSPLRIVLSRPSIKYSSFEEPLKLSEYSMFIMDLKCSTHFSEEILAEGSVFCFSINSFTQFQNSLGFLFSLSSKLLNILFLNCLCFFLLSLLYSLRVEYTFFRKFML